MQAMVSSATAVAFLPGVVTTGMPATLAIATSTLTGPPRATQISRSWGFAASTASVTGAPWTTSTSCPSSAAMTWSGVPRYSLMRSSEGVDGCQPGSSRTSWNVMTCPDSDPNARSRAAEGQYESPRTRILIASAHACGQTMRVGCDRGPAAVTCHLGHMPRVPSAHLARGTDSPPTIHGA